MNTQNFILTLALHLLFSLSGFAQINGNGQLETISVSVENMKYIDIQFNADIVINYNLEEQMTITADANVIPFIGRAFNDRKLTLDQIKWIEPSQQPKITIGTKELKKLYQGTHSSTWVKNINREKLIVEGNVGKVYLEGSVDHLLVDVSLTRVDASQLKIGKAEIDISGRGSVTVDKVKNLKADIDEDARLIRLSEPMNYIGMSKDQLDGLVEKNKPNPNLRYIDFKIKNNSWKRNNFVVVGPKKDGSSFSYGFPMMPQKSKSERWTVGSKIYKENKWGKRTLLVTIQEEDENQTVNLFQ